MVSKYVTIGAIAGAFFVGFAISYAVFATTVTGPTHMKFDEQKMFDMMMSQNPEMASKWLEDKMGRDSVAMKNMMMKMRDQQKPQSNMTQKDTTGKMILRDKPFPFNSNVPITIPMIDAYHDDRRLYFIHTEVSDKKMADMMTRMINFPTLHVPKLSDTPKEDMAKVFVFTNGVSGTGPYGGGPFLRQIDIFDSAPEDANYSAYRVPHLVTWEDDASPRVLTSVNELMQAKRNGELSIKPTDTVVHAPVVVWKDSQGNTKTADSLQEPFVTMPGIKAEITMTNTDSYIMRMNFQPENSTDTMMMN